MKVYDNNQPYKSPAGDQLWNSGRQNWIFSSTGDQEGAISDPEITILSSIIGVICFIHNKEQVADVVTKENNTRFT